jgi:hypothetical protein
MYDAQLQKQVNMKWVQRVEGHLPALQGIMETAT